MIRIAILVCIGGVSLGGTIARADGLPAVGVLPCNDKGVEPCVFSDRESGIELQIPIDWPTRHLQVLTETGPAASSRLANVQRWLAFEYVPEEPSYPQVPLFELLILPRDDWHRIGLGRAAPPGIEVAATASHTVVASLTPSNPYPPDSRDGQIYAALRPSLESVSLIVTAIDPP